MKLTCCTDTASAHGSFPLVSSLGVSFGGRYFSATAPDACGIVEVQIILLFSFFFVTGIFFHFSFFTLCNGHSAFPCSLLCFYLN